MAETILRAERDFLTDFEKSLGYVAIYEVNGARVGVRRQQTAIHCLTCQHLTSCEHTKAVRAARERMTPLRPPLG